MIVDRAHNAGLRVVGATLPPFGLPRADSVCTYPPDSPPAPVNPADEAMRAMVNTAIRPGGSLPFDAIADFDAVLRDPAAPDRIEILRPGPRGSRQISNRPDWSYPGRREAHAARPAVFS